MRMKMATENTTKKLSLMDPIGKDHMPFTADDPWDEVVAKIEEGAQRFGLRHFRGAGGHITDRPHVQLLEWNDATHQLGL